MSYSQKQLFEVWKKLIIFSGKKWKISSKEKQKIIPQLESLLTQTVDDSSVIGKKVHSFVTDILTDIRNDAPINIDSIDEDEYVENFLESEWFVLSYNSLLTQKDYHELAKTLELNKSGESYQQAKALKTQVEKTLKNINTQRISELLLIINIFHISNILKCCERLYRKSLIHYDTKTTQELLGILWMIRKFHHDIHLFTMSNIENQKIETTYMICDIKNNKLSFLPIQVTQKNTVSLVYRKVLLEKFSV